MTGAEGILSQETVVSSESSTGAGSEEFKPSSTALPNGIART